jgi:hypothetical protein
MRRVTSKNDVLATDVAVCTRAVLLYYPSLMPLAELLSLILMLSLSDGLSYFISKDVS